MTTGSAREAGGVLGTALDRWLAHLDAHGFRVGMRERLLVQALLARLAMQGELPADLHDMLALVAPLLCASRDQQRHYTRLLQDFAAAGAPSAESESDPSPAPVLPTPRTRRLSLAIVAALAAVLAGLWWGGVFSPESSLDPVPPPVPPAVQPRAAAANLPVRSFVVPPLPLPLQTLQPPAWSGPVRVAAGVTGALALTLTAATVWASRRRRMAMSGVRTDEALEDHLLHDAAPVDVAPPPALARAVSRTLRQRIGGEARTLDLRASLRATVAAQGAFTPRWRQLHQTPEYLALVDRRHPHDHHAVVVLAQLDALAHAGVALQVWCYEGSPSDGCWLRGGHGNDDALTRRRVPLPVLTARAAGQRLMVFGPVDVLQDPLGGGLQTWAAALHAMPQRAWITPQPAHAWGACEALADSAGFLVLPLQETAVVTLADWFASGRLDMALDPDTPTSVPALLGDDPMRWVTQRVPPPADTRAELLRQLRAMLGGQRFQWLCGCAIFPRLTPALTLALGRLVLPDARALALGMAAFSALPWFRWGRMPDWLRLALLTELAPDIRGRFAAEVHQRLDSALQTDEGTVLADVATRRRRLLGALRQRRGPLRDAVLADFVRADTDPALAQRLPEGLRRRLFKDGDPAEGMRWPMKGVAALGAVALLLAATPAWQQLAVGRATPALALTTPALVDSGNWHADFAAELRAVGEAIVVGRAEDGRLAQVNFAPSNLILSVDLGVQAAAAAPLSSVASDGRSLRIDNGRVQLLATDGAQLGAPLDQGTGSAVVAAVFTPSGGRVVGLTADGKWVSWGTPWDQRPQTEAVAACNDGTTDSPLARQAIDAIAAEGGSSPVIFSGNAAARLKLPAARPGEIAISLKYDAARANRIADRLRGTASRLPQPTWAAPALTMEFPELFLVVAACSTTPAVTRDPGPAPNPKPATTDPLQAMVDALFATDATERTSAAAKLVADRERLSDAVLPAITLALARQAKAPVVEPALSGVYNVLVLLNAASPATLRRESARIQQLVQQSALNGDKTAQLGKQVLARLKQAQGLKSTIYLRIADDAQRPLAQDLAERLSKAGMQTESIEYIGDRAPTGTEIRVQGFSDRTVARVLRDAAASYGGATLRTVEKRPANDTYEVWLGRDLCLQRMVEGCRSVVVSGASVSETGNPSSTGAYPTVSVLTSLLGEPVPLKELTALCQRPTEPRIARNVSLENVGPFRMTALKPALEEFRKIFAVVESENIDLYRKLGSAGGLCVRSVRGATPSRFAINSWGVALDITINGNLMPYVLGNDFPAFKDDFEELDRYFAKFGFIRRKGEPKYIASEETIRGWIANGRLE